MDSTQSKVRDERLVRSLPTLDLSSTDENRSKSERRKNWKQRKNEALTYIVSAFYAKLLVILGIALPVTDSIAYEDYETYDGFYLYLYSVSVAFLLYMYIKHFKEKSADNRWGANEYSPSFTNSNEQLAFLRIRNQYVRYGGFYFRLGVTGFGIGSVIYSGLQFGQYFELSSKKDCDNILKALKPLSRIIFALMQMLFIFSYTNFIDVHKSPVIAKFGLMHMIATNICEWLFVLIQETKYDIFRSASERRDNANRDNITLSEVDFQFLNSKSFQIAKQLYEHNCECLNSTIMDSILLKSETYLSPCCVEYSFLCAVILVLMWKNCESNGSSPNNQDQTAEKHSGYNVIYSRRHSQFSVDCAQAHKGLFSGILILAMTIISLIMFFELVSYKEYNDTAVLQVNVWEALLFVTGTIASTLSMFALRGVGIKGMKRDLQLEHLLLLVTQSGVFMYFLFQIIGAALMGLNKGTGGFMRIITPLCALVQSSCQTILIFDARRRHCTTTSQIRSKPGKQLITFLLVANIALWIVNRVKNNRAFSHPNQMDFYGVLAWNIITHVSMPLVVSYRFQATVCFYEIWKHVYKTPHVNQPYEYRDNFEEAIDSNIK